MYNNKVFKNYQVNLGNPFMIHVPQSTSSIEESKADDLSNDAQTEVYKEDPEIIIKEAKQKAENIIKEAETEAARIIESAKNEAEREKRAIEEQARMAGYRSGAESSKRQYEKLIREAELIKKQTKDECDEILESLEPDIVNMVLDIAKKVIGREVSQNKEIILDLIKQALEKSSAVSGITVRVSAEDYDFVEQNREKILLMNNYGIDEIGIKKDHSLEEGSCVVETPLGNIDTGVQTKLRKIDESFRKMSGRKYRVKHQAEREENG